MRSMLTVLAIGGCFVLGFYFGMADASPDTGRRGALQNPQATGASKRLSPRASTTSASQSLPGPVDLNGLLGMARDEDPIASEAAMIRVLEPLGKEQWAALFAQLASRPAPGDSGTILRRALLRLWAAAAPEEALQAIVRHPRPGSGVGNDDEADIVVLNLAPHGFAHTAAMLKSMPAPVMSRAWQALAAWCVEHDPTHVGEALQAWVNGPPGSNAPMNASLMAAWIDKDRAAAQAWMDSLRPSRFADPARRSFCDALMRGSIAGAEEWITSLASEEKRKELRKHLAVQALHYAPPEQAADYLRRNPATDPGLWSVLASRWAGSDADAALTWASTACPNAKIRSVALRACAAAMTRGLTTWVDAEAVAARMPDQESRNECMTQALANLPPAETAAHLDKATGPWRFHALRQAMTGDPPLPLEQALALAPEFAAMADGYVGETTVRLLEERGAQTALEWAATLPGKAADREQLTVWYHWTQRDPATAAAAVLQLPESPSRETALQAVSGEWANNDAASATAWLADLAPGADKDAAAASMAPLIVAVDPDGALAWAAAISDADQRERVLRSVKPPPHIPVTERWRSAVEAAPLSTEEKAALLPR